MKGHYSDAEKRQMQITAQAKNKSRLQELIDFSKLSDFERLGIASCAGMFAYAKKLAVLLQEAGFEIYLVHCKESGLNASEIDAGMCGPSCDPVSQADYLNSQNTDLNIIMGLCLGHGLLFEKHSLAPVTTLVVKDFATGHKTVEELA